MITCVVATLGLPPALAQGAAQLRVTSATEPPDGIRLNGKWRAGATIANQGTSRSRATRAFFYLVTSSSPSATDLRRTLSTRTRVPRLASRAQHSVRVTLTVPANVRGTFFVFTCAGAARARAANANCHLSGQTVTIPTPPPPIAPAGPAGAPGAPGAKGDKGDPGSAGPVTTVGFPRATLDTGFANFNEGETAPHSVTGTPPNTDVATEGSTQTVELAKVGPFTFTALCREAMPWEGFSTEGGKDEAKVLVTHDIAGATMAFRGAMGSRANVPAGRGTAGADNALGGEGQHQIVATFRQRDEGFSTKPSDSVQSATPPTGRRWDRGQHRGPTDQDVSGFQATSTYIALSNGAEVVFSGYAGIDVNGIGTPDNLQADYPDDDFYDKAGEDDRCSFGGFVTLVSSGS